MRSIAQNIADANRTTRLAVNYLSIARFGGPKLREAVQLVETRQIRSWTGTLELLWNKVFRLRASGHGCSVTGPVLLAGWYLGLPGIVVSALCYVLIFWASVTAKRHKWDEFLGGSVLCFAACGISWLLCNYFAVF